MTPRDEHRPLLWAVSGTWLLFGVLNMALAPRLAAGRWRAVFSAAWTVFSAFVVAGVGAADGAVDSPLLYMLFLPVAYAALSFTPWVAGVCGFSALAATVVVVVTDTDIQTAHPGAFVLLGVLAGASVLSVAAAQNRTSREHYEQVLGERIAQLASTDGLTGCAVHRVFHERLESEIARSVRNGHPLSLVMIDVDEFKGVNDTYGHLVGDHVLAGVGTVLRTHARSFDLVGRLGGDEFGVLLPDTEPEAAGVFAARIREATTAALEVPVTLSIGVSGFDPATPTAEHMLDEADFALYQIKRSGRCLLYTSDAADE